MHSAVMADNSTTQLLALLYFSNVALYQALLKIFVIDSSYILV